MRFLLASLCASILFLSGCNVLENVAESDPVVDLVGLDFSACVGGGFDVCMEFLSDNDEALLGTDLNDYLIELVLQNINTQGISTVDPKSL